VQHGQPVERVLEVPIEGSGRGRAPVRFECARVRGGCALQQRLDPIERRAMLGSGGQGGQLGFGARQTPPPWSGASPGFEEAGSLLMRRLRSSECNVGG
jgi:hypothetical protein